MNLRMLVLLLTVAVLQSGCKKDDDDDSGNDESEEGPAAPDCQAITDACHMFDDGKPGDINTCHSMIAHENEPGRCAAEKARCVGLCAAAADAGK